MYLRQHFIIHEKPTNKQRKLRLKFAGKKIKNLQKKFLVELSVSTTKDMFASKIIKFEPVDLLVLFLFLILIIFVSFLLFSTLLLT